MVIEVDAGASLFIGHDFHKSNNKLAYYMRDEFYNQYIKTKFKLAMNQNVV